MFGRSVSRCVVIASVLAMFAAACGGVASTPPVTPGSMAVSWRIGSGKACNYDTTNNLTIATVNVSLWQGATKVKELTNQQCSSGLVGVTGANGSVLMSGVNPGTYEVKVSGVDNATPSPNTFSGSRTGVAVSAGKQATAPEVRISKVAPDANPQTVTLNWIFATQRLPNQVCSAEGLTKVNIEGYFNGIEKKLDKQYDCSLTAAPTEKLAPGAYGFVAEAVDAAGVIKYRGTADLTVIENGTADQNSKLITLSAP